jgi:hypothetical protein
MFLASLTWIVGLSNAIAGVFLCLDPGQFPAAKGTFLLLSFTALTLYVHYFSHAFLYQLRMIFLAVIGYYAGIVKFIDSDLSFTHFGIPIQTLEVGVKMYGMTSIALFGAAIGFSLVNLKPRGSKKAASVASLDIPWRGIYWFTGPCIILIGYLSARSYGPVVWKGTYASEEAGGQLLGNLQSMGVILLGLNVLASIKMAKFRYSAFSFFLGVYFLLWGIFFRGGRLEFLAGLLAIFVGIPAAFGKRKRVSLFFYLWLVAGAVSMEFWGYLRSSLSSSSERETMWAGYVRMYESGVFFAGTISGIASSYANIIDMVDKKVVEFQFGIPYLEYLLRTPPEFLYPGRPKDLAFIFDTHGYISIGGFFEIGEAYLSFGLFGVFLVPLLISYIMGTVYKRAIKGSLFFYIQLLALISVFMRGAWYQTFAYYKAMVTGTVIYFGVILVTDLLKSFKNAVRKPGPLPANPKLTQG